MKLTYSRAAFLSVAIGALSMHGSEVFPIGWPSNYQGVMLQGFYWDSYEDTKWTKLESQAYELSKYFDLIWIPNSGRCGGYDNMGYMPQYWFTNHNSSFGTEKELLSMISTFKDKGTGIIADCVINHRNGVSNWYDFPKETWDGKTWHIGLEGICSNDEMAYASGQPKPTGNHDTGENFDGCRDLDHSNAIVQDNCKNYVKCLKEKYGYVGMRYDMVKGYGGEYNKIYNNYANVEYSVGEYWDGSYDAVAAWIEATGKTSAAFDFPCKYAINEAFHSNDLRKLVWKAEGTTDQPAGMIHHRYQRYAVTFVDNHDTYRDGSKFNGNVMAANAFILFSPGTPCIFLPHYKAHKSEINKLIGIRNAAGIRNQSAVKVLKTSADCYMAEITGTKGKVVVKVGSAMVSPEGYVNDDIKASGNDYCVWTKVNVQDITDDPVISTAPESLYIIGHADGNDWSPEKGVKMNKSGEIFSSSVDLKQPTVANSDGYAYFSFVKKLGSSWDAINVSGNRFGPSSDLEISVGGPAVKFIESTNPAETKAYKVKEGCYDIKVDWKTMTLTVLPQGTVGASEIREESSSTPLWYDLQGNRVAEPQPGCIYIRVIDGRATKCVARF